MGRGRLLRLGALGALGLLLVACQRESGPRVAPAAPRASAAPTSIPAPEATPQPTSTPWPASRPPGVTLAAESGAQRGGLGSYCWLGRCVDAVGRIVPLEPIEVSQREQVAFEVDGPAPASFRLSVYAAERGQTQALGDGASQAWQDQGVAPVAETNLGGGSAQPYRVDLAPGRYVLELRAEWQAGRRADKLEASYGFLLDVVEREVEDEGVQVGTLSLDQAQLREYQGSADAGHQPWRLDPLPTAMEVGRSLGLDPVRDRFSLASRQFDQQAGTWRAIVRVVHDGQPYEMLLVQPTKVGQEGIWAVTEVRRIE